MKLQMLSSNASKLHKATDAWLSKTTLHQNKSCWMNKQAKVKAEINGDI